jgi:hypothetical protein
MRRFATLLAAAAIVTAPALADAGGNGKVAQRGTPASRTYLSPIVKKGHVVGFHRSATGPRGVVRKLKDGMRVTFGKLGLSRALPDTVFAVPGHTLGWTSMAPAAAHFLGNPKNGAFAAVYVPKTGTWHANGPKGRKLEDTEVASTRFTTIEFTDPMAGQEQKSVEIASAIKDLSRAHGTLGPQRTFGRRTNIRWLEHSAGAAQADATLLGHIEPQRDGVKFTRRVTVGGIQAPTGSWTGNVGGKRIMGKVPFFKRMRQAASELAEESTFLSELDANRAAIDAKIEGPTYDIALEGAPTPRFKGRPGWGTGDGFVQSRDVGRPGGHTLVLRGIDPLPTNHLFQIRYPGTIKAAEEILTAE